MAGDVTGMTMMQHNPAITENPHVTLVLGGARSGKSVFAERLAAATGLSKCYVATAQVFDAEMRVRVDHHRARREGWTTVEESDALEAVIADEAAPHQVLLVDCLTLWVTNLMMADADIDARSDALCAALSAAAGPVILVTNEVGLGIVPDNAMARAFRDHAGRLHQKVAQVAGKVHFMAAGLPLTMKG